MAGLFPESVVDLDTPPSTPPRIKREAPPKTPPQQKRSHPPEPAQADAWKRPKTGPPVKAEQRPRPGPPVQAETPAAIVKSEDPAEMCSLSQLVKKPPDEACLAVVPHRAQAQKLTKREQRELNKVVKTGSEVLFHYNITFPTVFFPMHDYHCPKNHWRDFQVAAAGDTIHELECEVCRRIAREYMKPEDADETKLKPLKPSLVLLVDRMEVLRREEGMEVVKKGRPFKSASRVVPLHNQLFQWLEERRKGIYEHLEECRLRCKLCDDIVDARRASTIHFVLQHECSDGHWRQTHSMPRRICEGLRLACFNTAEMHVATYSESFDAWVQADMPWTCMGKLPHSCYRVEENTWLRAMGCEEAATVLTEDTQACARCMQLANNRKFVGKVLDWAVTFDMVALLHASYTNNTNDRRRIIHEMQHADYADLLEPVYGLVELDKLEYAATHDFVAKIVGTTPKMMMNDAAKNYLASRFGWLPRHLPPRSTRSLGRHVDFLVGSSEETGGVEGLWKDMQTGKVHEQETCRTLLSCVLARSRMLGRNTKRLTSSTVPGVQSQALADVGFLLSSVSSKQALMSLFGLNHRTLGRCPAHFEGIPEFFDASHIEPDTPGETSQLVKNCAMVLELLGLGSTKSRNCMISFDETVMWPTYSTWKDRHGSFFIGGADDKTKIPTSTTHANQLRKSDLAQTVIVYLLKRTDTNRAAYDILMRPRRLKSITAASNLEEVGQVWEACTKANCGMPPLSSAHDNATTQRVFSVLFLGMLPPHTYADKTFWKDCSTMKFPASFPEYSFATLCYKGHPLFDHNDAAHTQKNVVEATRKRTRTLLCSGHFVSRAPLVLHQLPPRAYRGCDNQSDKEAAYNLSPAFLKADTWDSWGALIWQYETCLTTGVWLAAAVYHPLRLLEQAFTGYYLTLLNIKDADCASGPWQLLTMSKTTCQNILYTVGHLIQRLLLHPASAPCRPDKTTEQPSEYHFGKIKRGVGHSLPSLKACIYSTHRVHIQQKRDGIPAVPKQMWSGVDPAEAAQIAARARLAACTFRAVVGVKETPEAIGNSLAEWWRQRGCKLLLEVQPTLEEAPFEIAVCSLNCPKP